MAGRSIFATGEDSISHRFRFTPSGDFDLLLRLSAPSEERGSWELEPLLQSRQDPSYLLSRSTAGGFLPLLLQQCALAAKVCPLLPLSGTARALSPGEAFSFLREDAFLLEQANFAVRIPSLPKAQPTISLRPAGSLRGSASRAVDLLHFDCQVILGESELSLAELEALAHAKEHLVVVRDKWMELDPEQAERLVALLRDQKGTGPDPLALSLRAADLDVGFEVVAGGKRYPSLIAALLAERPRFVEPEAFVGELRPYQREGVAWLSLLAERGIGALLADDMGLGKTVQVIAFLLARRDLRPVLIICPRSVIGNWSEELRRFAPTLGVAIHHGSARSGGESFARVAARADVVITSYAITWRDEEEIGRVGWGAVVLDEAQNIKNPFTKQARQVKGLSSRVRLALTGTPVENSLSELWSLMGFLNPGYLGTWDAFRERFAKPIEAEGDMQKAALLKSALSPVLLRRKKTDKGILAELPEKNEITEWCGLTPEQATLYKAVVNASLREIEGKEGGRRKIAILAALTKLKQICNHPANLLKDSKALGERSGKVDRLRELLGTMVSNGESCLLFTQFTEMGEMLVRDLEQSGIAVRYLHGGLGRKARDALVRDFQSSPEPVVFVLSLRAGGTGLNLTRATNVIHFDRWWNPAVEDQASDRAYRIGQTKNVFVYKLVTRGTIEERIDILLEEKRALAESVIGGGFLEEVDRKGLRAFFALDEAEK